MPKKQNTLLLTSRMNASAFLYIKIPWIFSTENASCIFMYAKNSVRKKSGVDTPHFSGESSRFSRNFYHFVNQFFNMTSTHIKA
jgi:hypothetical protein